MMSDALRVQDAVSGALEGVGIDASRIPGSPQADFMRSLQRIPAFGGSLEAYEREWRASGITEEHINKFRRLGIALQPKQLEFIALARQCDLPGGPEEIGLGGARGGSKSFSVFSQVTVDDCDRCPNLKVLYLRNTRVSATEQLEDMVQSILKHHPGADAKKGRVHFDNGSRVIIGGYNDDRSAISYLGMEYDIIVIEEASQLSAKAHEMIRASNRSSKYDKYGRPWRPRRYLTTNPLGVGHRYFKERFVDNERKRMQGKPYNPKHRFIFATVDDNSFVNEEYIGVLDEMTGAEYEAYRRGNWDVSAGAYFSEWDEGVHVIPMLRGGDVKGMRSVWASMDFGFNHWNVFQLHCENGDGITFTFDELSHRLTQPDEIAPDIYALLASYGLDIMELDTILVGTDAFARTGHSRLTVAEQYAEKGIELEQAYVDPGSRVARALYLAKLLGSPRRGIHPTWYITENSSRLIATLPYLERDPNKSEDVMKWNMDANGEGGDDAYDCAGYGLYKPHQTGIA
jgi:phage terminase large subunit